MNWTEEETDKFIDLLYEMKAKGKDISYPKIREQMMSYSFPQRTDQQMKNHYNVWGRKIRMLNYLFSLTGVGYDAQTELPIVDDKQWENIVHVSMFII